MISKLDKEHIKTQVLKDIEDISIRDTTTNIVAKYCNVDTWYRWLRADSELAFKFDLARSKFSSYHKQNMVELAKNRLYDLINEGNYKAIEFTLKNLEVDFNPAVQELIADMIKQAMSNLSDSDIDDTTYEKVVDSFKKLALKK